MQPKLLERDILDQLAVCQRKKQRSDGVRQAEVCVGDDEATQRVGVEVDNAVHRYRAAGNHAIQAQRVQSERGQRAEHRQQRLPVRGACAKGLLEVEARTEAQTLEVDGVDEDFVEREEGGWRRVGVEVELDVDGCDVLDGGQSDEIMEDVGGETMRRLPE